MRSWHVRIWKNIIHVAERVFVEGASAPFFNQETKINVLIAMQKEGPD
jgi:hypothetical protein